MNFLANAIEQLLFYLSKMITRLHILLGKVVLLQIEANGFGESHRIYDINAVILSLRVVLARCCFIFEHQFDELVILVIIHV